MNEVLQSILIRADLPDGSLFAAHEVARWPEGALDWLTGAGILRATEDAEEVLCEECPEGCWIRPSIRKDPKTGRRFGTYLCRRNEDVGFFRVDLARAQQWEFNLTGLAKLVAKAVAAKGKPAQVKPGRLFFLGTTKLDGKARELFLARGAAWKDAAIFAAPGRLRAALHPALLTLSVMPTPDLLPGRELAARPLAEIASFDGRDLSVCLDGAFPDVEPSPWPDVPNEVIKLDRFMVRYCEKLERGTRRSRRRALLGAARNGTVQMPPLAVPYKEGRPNQYFTHDLLAAWPNLMEEITDLPPLLPKYQR